MALPAKMNRCALIAAAGLVPAAVAAADVTVALAPQDKARPEDFPWQTARLTIRNDTGRLIRAVSLRWKAGGPLLLLPVPVAPGTVYDGLPVALPALSQHQRYTVRLLQADRLDAPAVAERPADVTWEPRQVEQTADVIFDPMAYADWAEALPRWPGPLLRLLFGLLVLGSVLAGAALLVRRPGLRIAMAAAAACGTAAAVGLVVARQEPLLVRYAGQPEGSLVVLTCRRTGTWTAPGAWVPLYRDAAQMASDTTVLSATHGAEVTVSPGQARLLRRRGRPPAASAPAGDADGPGSSRFVPGGRVASLIVVVHHDPLAGQGPRVDVRRRAVTARQALQGLQQADSRP